MTTPVDPNQPGVPTQPAGGGNRVPGPDQSRVGATQVRQTRPRHRGRVVAAVVGLVAAVAGIVAWGRHSEHNNDALSPSGLGTSQSAGTNSSPGVGLTGSGGGLPDGGLPTGIVSATPTTSPNLDGDGPSVVASVAAAAPTPSAIKLSEGQELPVRAAGWVPVPGSDMVTGESMKITNADGELQISGVMTPGWVFGNSGAPQAGNFAGTKNPLPSGYQNSTATVLSYQVIDPNTEAVLRIVPATTSGTIANNRAITASAILPDLPKNRPLVIEEIVGTEAGGELPTMKLVGPAFEL